MGFGYGMGDVMFAVIPTVVSVGFLLFFVMLAVMAAQGLRTWKRNNRSPRLTVPAQVVSKRLDVRRHRNGHPSSATWYYVTFQVDSGDRMEFSVSGPEYGMLAEGDRGSLTFQGTRFLEFKRG